MSENTVNIDFSKYEEFVCTKVKIHFIYTFLLSSFDLDEETKKKGENKIINLLKETFKTHKDSDIKVQIHWFGEDPLTSIEDTYLDPYLHLKISHVEIKEIYDMNREVLTVAKYQALQKKYRQSEVVISSMQRELTVLESGQGIIDYQLEFKLPNTNLFNQEFIVSLCNLGMLRRNFSEEANSIISKFLLVKKGKKLFLFDKFFQDVSCLTQALNSLFEKSVSWIDTDKNLKLMGNIQKYGNKIHWQDPFPLMEITVPDSIYIMAFLDKLQSKAYLEKKIDSEDYKKHKDILGKKYHKDLLTIIARSIAFQFPDSSFATSFGYFSDGYLANMCSTSAVFLHLYSRSCLAIKGESKSSAKHAKYIVPALVKTVGYLRMRWHAYVISSQWLDQIIENLSEKPLQFGETLQMIINSRREISRALSDPITYRLGSGSMKKIYELGIDIFRIRALERIITEKSNMIDKLYQNIFEQKRIVELEDISRKLLKDRTDI